MTEPSPATKRRQDAWDHAIHTFGTAYIFEKRAKGPKIHLKLLAFSGLALPLILGSYVTIFGREAPQLERALVISGVIAAVQAVVTLWALVWKWDDQYSASLEAVVTNYRLASRFKEFASNPPADEDVVYRLLKTELSVREAEDHKLLLKDKEKRMGLRAGLREFQRPCVACNVVPRSLTSSDCDVCGNF